MLLDDPADVPHHAQPVALEAESVLVIGPLALVDAVFVSSNVSKVVDRGWIPILAGARFSRS
ncbi:hypothetical protein [Caballeronia arationis]|jgi:KUP system potassium uptake protein|uniref:hypothetical protein n=1 Tax=Caballeronia arationis TaxID=1777142 RepID=UPI00135773FD|nr:hypothetical protein [Caballeronia arationis]